MKTHLVLKIKPCSNNSPCTIVRGLDSTGKIIRCPNKAVLLLGDFPFCTKCFEQNREDPKFQKELSHLRFIRFLKASDNPKTLINEMIRVYKQQHGITDSLLCNQ